MTSHRKLSLTLSRSLLALAAATALALPAMALERGVTPGGIAYVTGGVGESEQMALVTDKSAYSFWLTTAARGTGAFLGSVHVRIVDTRTRQTVLERDTDGPWLMAALPSGRYMVEVSTRVAGLLDVPGQTRRSEVSIGSGSTRQLTMHFDAD